MAKISPPRSAPASQHAASSPPTTRDQPPTALRPAALFFSPRPTCSSTNSLPSPAPPLEHLSSFRIRRRDPSPDTAPACPYRPRSELAPGRLPLSVRRVFPPYPAEAAHVNTALFAWARSPFVHARRGNITETIGGHQAVGQASGSSSFVRGSARRSGELQFCLFLGGCARPCPPRSIYLCSYRSHAAVPVRGE